MSPHLAQRRREQTPGGRQQQTRRASARAPRRGAAARVAGSPARCEQACRSTPHARRTRSSCQTMGRSSVGTPCHASVRSSSAAGQRSGIARAAEHSPSGQLSLLRHRTNCSRRRTVRVEFLRPMPNEGAASEGLTSSAAAEVASSASEAPKPPEDMRPSPPMLTTSTSRRRAAAGRARGSMGEGAGEADAEAEWGDGGSCAQERER